MGKIAIGVVGPGATATEQDIEHAFQLGRGIAAAGWVTLTGGMASGVMDAALRGAASVGGLTVGMVPNAHRHGTSSAIEVAILTDLGSGRNNVMALSSHAMVACGMSLGTASEVALALKAKRPVILLGVSAPTVQFFQQWDDGGLIVAANPAETIAAIGKILASRDATG
ncbi:MAG: cytochrome [Oscillatoriales cyanobacterium SM2_1_8]|nr:cytochrome [Oscillatoriales cyanobacterium SM2_1_8]